MPPQLRVDYADVDGNEPPGVAGFKKMKAANVNTVTMRAVYGRPYKGAKPCYLDECWPRDHQHALDAGLSVSPYLFGCVPKKGFVTPEPEDQANFFCDHINLTPPNLDGKPGYAVPGFDMEEASDILSQEQYFQWFLRMAKQIRTRIGVWPEAYLSDRVWEEYTGGHLPGQLAACSLWIAKPWGWAPNTPAHMDGAPQYNPKLVPAFGNQVGFYQFQGDALGIPGLTHTGNLSRCMTVGPGAKGQNVMWIQARAGGGLAIDGDYGARTTARIKEIQRMYSLDADGYTGADTRRVLGWMNPAPR